jgi:hypothetical protein
MTGSKVISFVMTTDQAVRFSEIQATFKSRMERDAERSQLMNW